MNLEQVVKHFGSQAAAADAIGIRQPSVCAWRAKGISPFQQLRIQKLTRGALKADKASREWLKEIT